MAAVAYPLQRPPDQTLKRHHYKGVIPLPRICSWPAAQPHSQEFGNAREVWVCILLSKLVRLDKGNVPLFVTRERDHGSSNGYSIWHHQYHLHVVVWSLSPSIRLARDGQTRDRLFLPRPASHDLHVTTDSSESGYHDLLTFVPGKYRSINVVHQI